MAFPNTQIGFDRYADPIELLFLHLSADKLIPVFREADLKK
jgi:hypothetical protein